MLDSIVNHFNVLLGFAGVAGLLTAGYQLWVPNVIRVRHHHAILHAFEWIARGGWLDLMQRGVTWLLTVLDMLYGAPRGGSAERFGNMLTVRSWQASAWIASFILFVLPFGVFSVLVPMMAVRDGRPLEWDGVIVLALVFFVLCGVFVILVRRTWSEQPRLLHGSGKCLIDDAVGMTVGMICILALFGTVSFVFGAGPPTRTSPIYSPYGVMIITLMASIVSLIVFFVAKTIRMYSFLAPLFFSAILILSLIGSGCLVFGVAVVSGSAARATSWLIGGACVLPVGAFIALRYSRYQTAWIRISPLPVGVIVMLLVLYSGAGTFGATPLQTIVRNTTGLLIWLTIPYVFAIYAAVYSNSIPDWISVATTRHVLSKAARANDVNSFVTWILLDIVVATACIIATLLILIGVFAFCGAVIQFATYIGGLDAMFSSPAPFFFDGSRSVSIILGVLRGRSVADITAADSAHAAGATFVAMLVALGATSILPTLLNAVLLVTLAGARALAAVVRWPVSYMHAVMVMPPGAGSDAGSAQLLRSSIIVGSMLTVGLAVTDLIWSQVLSLF